MSPLLDRLFEVYHENSKLNPFSWDEFGRIGAINSSPATGVLSSAATIDIGQLTTVRLPRAVLPEVPVETALLRRRSTDPGGSIKPISIDELSSIVFFSAGINGATVVDGVPRRPLRFCPSPGALYPIVVIVEAREAADLEVGAYYYDPDSHMLGRLAEDVAQIDSAVQQPGGSADVACRLWLLARFDRVSFKYGERAYRFALLEAGHIAQNMLLVAGAIGRPARPFGGFLDEHAKLGLGAQPFALDPLYYVAVG